MNPMLRNPGIPISDECIELETPLAFIQTESRDVGCPEMELRSRVWLRSLRR